MLIPEMTTKEEEENSSVRSSEESTDVHQDWGVVSVESTLGDLPGPSPNLEKSREEGSLGETITDGQEEGGGGVLILSGSEEEDDEKEEVAPKEEEEKDNLKLSFPGSDSMPSEVGTLDDFPEGESDAERSSVPSTDNSDPAVEWYIEHMTRLKKTIPKNRNRLALLGGVVCWLLATSYYFQERNRWRSSILRLEEDNQRLRLELEEARSAYLDWQKNDDQTNIVDNCWFQAKASIQLGPCAQDATDSAKQFTKSLLQKVEDFTDSMVPSPDAEGGDPAGRPFRKDDATTELITKGMLGMLGKSLWSSTDQDSMERSVESVKQLGNKIWSITEDEMKQYLEGLEGSEGVDGVDFGSAVVNTVHGVSEALAGFVKTTAEAADLNRSLAYVLDAFEQASNQRMANL